MAAFCFAMKSSRFASAVKRDCVSSLCTCALPRTGAPYPGQDTCLSVLHQRPDLESQRKSACLGRSRLPGAEAILAFIGVIAHFLAQIGDEIHRLLLMHRVLINEKSRLQKPPPVIAAVALPSIIGTGIAVIVSSENPDSVCPL